MISSMTLDALKQTALTIAATCLPQIPTQDGFCRAQLLDRQKTPLLTLSLQTLQAENGGFYGTATTDGVPYTQTGSPADCTLRFSLFLPRNSELDGETLLQTLAARLVTAEEADFYKLTLSDTTFSVTAQCFVTHLSVQSRFVLLGQVQTVGISQFQVEANNKPTASQSP